MEKDILFCLFCFWSYFNERMLKAKQAEGTPGAVPDSSWHLPAQIRQCLWTSECVKPVMIGCYESKVVQTPFIEQHLPVQRNVTAGHFSQTNPDVMTTGQAGQEGES